MSFRWVLVFLLALGQPAASQEVLSAQQIEALLTGNTIQGEWSGQSYTQYFDPAGTTVYVSHGRPAEIGRWRVNHDDDAYESWWQQTDWVAYKIVRDGTGYAWQRSRGHEPFKVLEGKQMSW